MTRIYSIAFKLFTPYFADSAYNLMSKNINSTQLIPNHIKINMQSCLTKYIEGEGEVAVFSAKCWDCRNRANLIESATPYHEAQMVGS